MKCESLFIMNKQERRTQWSSGAPQLVKRRGQVRAILHSQELALMCVSEAATVLIPFIWKNGRRTFLITKPYWPGLWSLVTLVNLP